MLALWIFLSALFGFVVGCSLMYRAAETWRKLAIEGRELLEQWIREREGEVAQDRARLVRRGWWVAGPPKGPPS